MSNLKSKVLQDLMDKMDSMQVDGLRSKFSKNNNPVDDHMSSEDPMDMKNSKFENGKFDKPESEDMSETPDQENSEEDDLKRMMALFEQKMK